jgi:hypothetical protein
MQGKTNHIEIPSFQRGPAAPEDYGGRYFTCFYLSYLFLKKKHVFRKKTSEMPTGEYLPEVSRVI